MKKHVNNGIIKPFNIIKMTLMSRLSLLIKLYKLKKLVL